MSKKIGRPRTGTWQDKFPYSVDGDLHINLSKFKARQYDAPTGDCIYMTGAKHPQGYPMIPGHKVSTEKNGMHTGHRISYVLNKGKIPQGMNVIHTCLDMRCVNPDHLFLGTAKERGNHMKEMGHTTSGRKMGDGIPRKQLNRKYKYSEDDIRFVRTQSLEDIQKRFGWPIYLCRRKKYAFIHERYQWLTD